MTRAARPHIYSWLRPGTSVRVWVLAPHLQSGDEHIDYYYDFSQSIAEYTRVFESLNMQWHWQPVTLLDYKDVIAQIPKAESGTLTLVLNLCDGDEINGTPGVGVIDALEQAGLIYTGSDRFFYDITTSKIPMKEAFDRAGVATPDWVCLNADDPDPERVFRLLGDRVIIKPAVSGGSMGVGIRNVVENANELLSVVNELKLGYRGWNLTEGGILAERFIEGPEYTLFISGSHDAPQEAHLYHPVQRVFHESLPEKERFLSFDRLWETYESESPMPANAHFYEYADVPDEWIEPVQSLGWSSYVATKGTGYTRIDIRQDRQTGKLFVLELNAQCGISEDENYTSIGAILKRNRATFASLVEEILCDALRRHPEKWVSFRKGARMKMIKNG